MLSERPNEPMSRVSFEEETESESTFPNAVYRRVLPRPD